MFDLFHLGNPSCMYDSVGLYQGTGINGERLAKFCGNEKPKYVYSSKGPMTVHFSTDEYRNGKGFMAQYTIEGSYLRFVLVLLVFSFVELIFYFKHLTYFRLFPFSSLAFCLV